MGLCPVVFRPVLCWVSWIGLVDRRRCYGNVVGGFVLFGGGVSAVLRLWRGIDGFRWPAASLRHRRWRAFVSFGMSVCAIFGPCCTGFVCRDGRFVA